MENLNTSCRDCAFAIFDDKEQVGCQLSRIQRFQNNGAILKTETTNGLKHFIIEGRECSTWREEKWLSGRKTPITDIYQEAKTRVSIIGYIDKRHNFKNIKNFINNSLNQTIKPNEIILINNNKENIKPSELSEYFMNIDTKNIVWKNSTVFGNKNKNEAIDSSLHKISSIYYSIFDIDISPPKDFVEQINNSILMRCERWVLLKPYKENGATINTLLAKSYGGNYPSQVSVDDGEKSLTLDNIIDKICYVAKESKQEFLIKNLEDICPSITNQ